VLRKLDLTFLFVGSGVVLGFVEKMNDSSVKNFAITEKKAQKPGGCVGIVFQLFEWKRKLAKKKLFSKKLLLPG